MPRSLLKVTLLAGLVLLSAGQDGCEYDTVTPPLNSTVAPPSAQECRDGGVVGLNESCHFARANYSCHIIACLPVVDGVGGAWNSTVPKCVVVDDDDEVPYGNHAIILVIAPSFAVLMAILFVRIRESQLANAA